MTEKEEIRQLLEDLKRADDSNEQRRIRRELRKRGYFVSRIGKAVVGVVARGRRGAAEQESVVTTLRLKAEVHRRLQLLAADEGRSANAIIEEILLKHLDAQGVPSRLERER